MTILIKLIISRSSTVKHPHVDLHGLVCGFHSLHSPNLDILGIMFNSKLTFEDHVRGIVSRVFQLNGILILVMRVSVDTSVLLRCYYAFVLPILEYCSQVWGSATFTFSFLTSRCVRWFGKPCSDPIQFGGSETLEFHVIVSSMSCCWTVYAVQC